MLILEKPFGAQGEKCHRFKNIIMPDTAINT